MNDRKLLELAAKANRMNSSWEYYNENRRDPYRLTWGMNNGFSYWNPLENDGDALRLAVKLNMLCDFGSHGVLVEAKGGVGPCTEVSDYRRAIVRVAAEIGKTL